MREKYIFMDVDGTLVGFDAKVPPSAIAALKAAHKRGHHLILATGRHVPQIYPELLELPFEGTITAKGAHVEHQGRTVYAAEFSAEELSELIEKLEARGMCNLVMTAKEQYADGKFFNIVLPFLHEAGYNKKLVDNCYGGVHREDELGSIRGAEKVMYFLSDLLPQDLSDYLGGRYTVSDYAAGNNPSKYYFGEITRRGVHKGSAIERYLEYVGADRADSIAIGDSGNDIDMIRYAAVGVAMGNATEPIKEAADLITDAVDREGIRKAFLQLGLIGEED